MCSGVKAASSVSSFDKTGKMHEKKERERKRDRERKEGKKEGRKEGREGERKRERNWTTSSLYKNKPRILNLRAEII